nr:hypothetical protein [Enterobacter sp. 638]
MLLPVFVCDGQNLDSAPTWAIDPRSASYVCSALYDVGRKYSRTAAHTWSPRYQNDHALCAPFARTP